MKRSRFSVERLREQLYESNPSILPLAISIPSLTLPRWEAAIHAASQSPRRLQFLAGAGVGQASHWRPMWFSGEETCCLAPADGRQVPRGKCPSGLSSRFRDEGDLLSQHRPKLLRHPPQPLAQVLLAPAHPDPHEPLDPEMTPRHDEHAPVDAHPRAELVARDICLVFHQADRARVGRREGELVSEPRDPLLHDREVVLKRLSRARVAPFAVRRGHRDARHPVRQFVGPDRDVVVLRPAFVDDLLRPDDPADADARDAVGLRQAARDDDAVAHAPEALRARAGDLGAEVDLVREQVRADLLAARDDAAHRVLGERLPRRVVRVREVDQPRPRRDRALELLPVRLPAGVEPQAERR